MSTFVDGADVRFPAEAHHSATPPSTTPEPADGPGHRGKKESESSGSRWLQDEIARRIAAKSSASGGRHARRDNPDPTTTAGYAPRHSTATPRSAAAAPGPADGPPPPAPPKRPRRGPAGANGDTEAWTGPDRSGRDRSLLGGPSLQALGAPSRLLAAPRSGAPARPFGAAAARLLSPPVPPVLPVALPETPAPPPGAVSPDAVPPSAVPPSAVAPTAASPTAASPTAVWPSAVSSSAAASTGAWPITPARPLTPPGGFPRRDPGPPTAPMIDAPRSDVQVHDDYADDSFDAVPGTGPHDEILWSVRDMPPSTPPGGPRVDTPLFGAAAVPEQRTGEQLRGARFPHADDDDDDFPKRVRVVLAERKGVARPVRTVVDIQEATAVGELLRTDLIGSQLRVALRFAAGAGITLGILPLLFALFPAIGEFDVFGFRLPWLLLGFLVYPFLLGLGWWHTRTAERVEQNFADHVQE